MSGTSGTNTYGLDASGFESDVDAEKQAYKQQEAEQMFQKESDAHKESDGDSSEAESAGDAWGQSESSETGNTNTATQCANDISDGKLGDAEELVAQGEASGNLSQSQGASIDKFIDQRGTAAIYKQQGLQDQGQGTVTADKGITKFLLAGSNPDDLTQVESDEASGDTKDADSIMEKDGVSDTDMKAMDGQLSATDAKTASSIGGLSSFMPSTSSSNTYGMDTASDPGLGSSKDAEGVTGGFISKSTDTAGSSTYGLDAGSFAPDQAFGGNTYGLSAGEGFGNKTTVPSGSNTYGLDSSAFAPDQAFGGNTYGLSAGEGFGNKTTVPSGSNTYGLDSSAFEQDPSLGGNTYGLGAGEGIVNKTVD